MAKKKKLKKKAKKFIGIIIGIGLIFIACEIIEYQVLNKMDRTPVETHENDYYLLRDFGYLEEKSKYDYNQNGLDDYTDILNGAKKLAEINPAYISKYYAGGYPPENEGVCTDVIWWALKEAGYLLKDMIAKDIREDEQAETGRYDIPIIDDNIDFRRVDNQEIFLMKYAEILNDDIYDIGAFQAGDIITFNDSEHIAMISDKRNAQGIPYLIQNSDEEQTEKEEDVLLETEMVVTGHYRFTYTEEIQDLIDRM